MAAILSEPGAPAARAFDRLCRPFLLLTLLLAGTACSPEAGPEDAPTVEREQVVAGHCEQRQFEGSAFTACRYDKDAHELVLLVSDEEGPLRSFDRLERHLGARADRLLFAMNAGMYDEAGLPIGLHVEAGEERQAINRRDGPGNFHMKPNGVFAVTADGTPSIVDSAEWDDGEARWATQSGPLLVKHGTIHPAIQPNGASLNVRNGVGVTDSGAAWFAISDEPVSFGRFTRFFRDGLGCDDALFLDGSVSSLWDPAAQRRDAYRELGPMVAVLRRTDRPTSQD